MNNETEILIDNNLWKDFITQAEISPIDKVSNEDMRRIFYNWNVELFNRYEKEYKISALELMKRIDIMFEQVEFKAKKERVYEILKETLKENIKNYKELSSEMLEEERE